MEKKRFDVSRSKWSVLVFYSICLVGVLIFAKGFFPTKSTSKANSNGAPHPNTPRDPATLARLLAEDFVNVRGTVLEEEVVSKDAIPAPYKKLVLVVVDAMRADFVTSSHHNKHMPFLRNVINSGHGVMYTAKAKAPTVTMPRLKALATGSIPGYIDVLLNMDQTGTLNEDNVISRMRSADKKIVFFGDNVWISLFPNAFLREDGTSAFFVADYTEVDFNVTRHLSRELNKKKDWDVMILHYLGMDHIGHLAGPNSPLMPSKLSEMDSVFSSIYSSLKEDREALMVVTSDHGMSDQGSHGGTTTHEVDTPLVFISTTNKLGPADDDVDGRIEQTDFAATIALLLGLRIPTGSLGHVIPSTLNVLSREKTLYALQYNCHQLLSLAATSIGLDSFNMDQANPLSAYRHGLNFHNGFVDGKQKGSAELFHSARTNYITALTTLSDKLTSKLASYDYVGMVFGSFVLLCGFCGVLFAWFASLLRTKHGKSMRGDSSRNLTRMLFTLWLGCLLHAATLPGSSFVEEEHQIWHFLTISMLSALFVAFLRAIARSEKLPSTTPSTSTLYDAQFSEGDSALRLRKDLVKGKAWPMYSNASSIGENHDENVQNHGVNEVVSLDDEDPSSKDKSIIKKEHVKHVAVGLMSIIVHRTLRSWNQTGIKHAAQPDIGDWFNIPQHKAALSAISFVGLLATFLLLEVLCTAKDIIRTLISLCGLCAVFWYRLAVGSVIFPFYVTSKSLGLYEAWLAYACAGLLFMKMMYHRIAYLCAQPDKSKKSCSSRLCACLSASSSGIRYMDCFQSAVALLSALLLRPHNHCALAFNIFLYLSIYRLLWPVVIEGRFDLLDIGLAQFRATNHVQTMSSLEAIGRIALAYWFGQMAYFTMGNSNSFATVDLSAAYIGLSSSVGLSNYLAAGFLGVFATYIGPILWTSLCVTDIIKAKFTSTFDYNMQESSASPVMYTLSALLIFALSVYVAVATGHRYHLFIWSVFSPKLLYEIVSTAVHFVLLVIITLLW